jgi:hypothetical protein
MLTEVVPHQESGHASLYQEPLITTATYIYMHILGTGQALQILQQQFQAYHSLS